MTETETKRRCPQTTARAAAKHRRWATVSRMALRGSGLRTWVVMVSAAGIRKAGPRTWCWAGLAGSCGMLPEVVSSGDLSWVR